MKIVNTLTILILLFVANLVNAQTNVISLKVIGIHELDDNVFEIKALKETGDTIRILSIKETIDNNCLYEKIKKGAEYQFELRPEPSYIDNFIIRVKNKVYWKTGDNPKDMPYFANNVKNDSIKKD